MKYSAFCFDNTLVLWYIIALIYCVLINPKFNWLSKNAGCSKVCTWSCVSLHGRSVNKQTVFAEILDKIHFFSPPCHTYSVAATSSAIKSISTNNTTLFITMTGIPQLSCDTLSLKFGVKMAPKKVWIKQMQTAYTSHITLL